MRHIAADHAGQSMAEFAVVILVLMVIVLGIVDLARAVHARNVIVSAAREGARYGVTHPTDTAGIVTVAQGLAAGLDADDLSIAVTRPDSTQVQVDVSYTFHPVSLLIAQYLDGGAGTGVVLRGRSIMRTE